MGFLDKVKEFLEPVIGFIDKAFDWISDPDNQSTVKGVIQFLLTVVSAVGALNEPLPKRDRPKAVRTVVEVLQIIPAEGLREMAKIKEETDIDKLNSGQLDALIGEAIGGFVQVEKQKEPKKGKAK